MVYKEFLSAARKHNHTCELIRQEIERLGGESCDNNGKVKSLTLNLYYLAGYVIECSLKFGIYKSIGYDRKSDITELDSDELTYSDNIQHHKFGRYVDVFNKHSNIAVPLVNPNASVPLVSREVKTLYDRWDAPLRYRYSCLKEYKYGDEFRFVREFSEIATEIFTAVKQL